MTWPAGIALAAGLIAALLITRHQHQTPHRSNRTQHTHPQDGEPRS